jgi:hypothetical protein
MKILVKQIKMVLVDFVSTIEGSEEQKRRKWGEALNTFWQSTRNYEQNYQGRVKDMNIFDFAWTKCDVTHKELAKKFNTSQGAIKQALWRVRDYAKKNIQSSQ